MGGLVGALLLALLIVSCGDGDGTTVVPISRPPSTTPSPSPTTSPPPTGEEMLCADLDRLREALAIYGNGHRATAVTELRAVSDGLSGDAEVLAVEGHAQFRFAADDLSERVGELADAIEAWDGVAIITARALLEWEVELLLSGETDPLGLKGKDDLRPPLDC